MGLENLTELFEALNITDTDIDPFSFDFWQSAPPEILNRVTDLITLLKITGIVILVYCIFLTVKTIFSFIRNRRIAKMYFKLNDMDNKIDLLLHRARKVSKDRVSDSKKDKKKSRKGKGSRKKNK